MHNGPIRFLLVEDDDIAREGIGPGEALVGVGEVEVLHEVAMRLGESLAAQRTVSQGEDDV